MNNKEHKAIFEAYKNSCIVLKVKGDLTEKGIADLDKEYHGAKAAVEEANTTLREKRDELNQILRFAGMPLIANASEVMSQADLITKLEEVMPSFPTGANGKEIADKIGMGVTTNEISALYWTDDQTTLKKSGSGLKTKYTLATADDLEEINKAKETEKAKREADKAKRDAKK
jgi:hypothetical protein